MNNDAAALAAKFTPVDGPKVGSDRQSTMARFSPCGKFLVAAGSDGLIRRWRADDPAWPELSPIGGHSGWVTSLQFAAQGNLLFAADSWGRLAAWRYDQEKPTALWQVEAAHDGWLRALALSPDGATLASCGRDRQVKLWSAADGQLKQSLPRHEFDVYTLAFHPQSAVLVSGDGFGNVRHWDLAGPTQVRVLDARILYLLSRLQDVGGVRVLRFSPDGKLLIVAGAKPTGGGFVNATPHLLAFDWESGRLLHTLAMGPDTQGFVYDLAWHPAGFWMGVSCGLSGEGRLFFHRWPDEAPFLLRTNLPNCQSLAVHPNGRRLGVLHTNPASNFNGRQLQDGKYVGNFTPIQIIDLPEQATS